MTDLAVVIEVGIFQEHPLKVLMPANGLIGELHLRATMPSSYGQSCGSFVIIHYFCSTYGSCEEIHHTNKLNQDLHKA